MQPRIKKLPQKKLIGMRLNMSFSDYCIEELWKNFNTNREEITNKSNENFISMVVYDSNHFVDFSPSNLFERWAAVEVSSYEFIPAKMETFDLVEGLYAIFDYKGLNNNPLIFNYIFEEWLPHSIYELDDRPHFEVLGENYKNNDPNSEEEIWIPIKVKS